MVQTNRNFSIFVFHNQCYEAMVKLRNKWIKGNCRVKSVASDGIMGAVWLIKVWSSFCSIIKLCFCWNRNRVDFAS